MRKTQMDLQNPDRKSNKTNWMYSITQNVTEFGKFFITNITNNKLQYGDFVMLVSMNFNADNNLFNY